MSEADAYKIGKVDKISKSVEAFRKYVDQQTPGGVPTDRGYFESLMRLEKKAPETATVDAIEKRPSLMDEVGRVNHRIEQTGKATSRDLVTNTQKAIVKIEDLKAQLNTPELELKAGVQKLLKNKLTGVNESLKIAFSKAGIEYIPPERQFGSRNPVQAFLSYLSDGQSKLETIGTHVESIAASGKEMTPSQLLSVQMKVNHVQQELEFFTNLLNKGLESTKTVMNVQV